MLRFACSSLAAVLVAVLLQAALATQAQADSSCADLKVCFWEQSNYNGDRKSFDADDAGDNQNLGAFDRSAKNKFGSRKVQIKDSQLNVVWCLDAGETKDNLPGSAQKFRIGATGSVLSLSDRASGRAVVPGRGACHGTTASATG